MIRKTLAVIACVCLSATGLLVIVPSGSQADTIPFGTWQGFPVDNLSEDLNPYSITTDLFATENWTASQMGNYTELVWIDDPSNGAWWTWAQAGDRDFYDCEDSSDTGYLYWNATGPGNGNFGTSTTRFQLTDPIVEHEYYTLKFCIRAAIFDGLPNHDLDNEIHVDFLESHSHSVRVGLTYYDEDLPITATWPEWGEYSYIQQPSVSSAPPFQYKFRGQGVNFIDDSSVMFDQSGGSLVDANGTYWTQSICWHNFSLNPYTEMPWTYDEVCAMTGTVWLSMGNSIFDFDAYLDYDFMLTLTQFYIVATPVDYEAEEYPGAFILRPNGDDPFNEEWYNESDSATNLFASVNETKALSDQDDTYIYWDPSGGGENWVGFSLTDPPDWAYDTSYEIRAWFIMQSSDDTFYTFEEEIYEMWVLPLGEYPQRELGYIAHSFWFNDSLTSIGPNSEDNWTLESLTTLRVAFHSYVSLGAYWNISQIAVLCIPSSYVYVPVEEDASQEFTSFLLVGDNFKAIFGVMGFLGLIAVPLIACRRYQSGGGGLAILAFLISGICVFFGFLIVGI